MTTTLLTSLQAAQYLGLTVRTLKVWRHYKKGPPFLRLGTCAVRYELDSIRAWTQQTGGQQ